MKENRKISKKKVGLTVLSLLLVAGLSYLFISASNAKNQHFCSDIVFSYSNGNGSMMTDTALLRKQLTADSTLNPIGKKLSDIKISKVSEKIKEDDWVDGTDVYVGNNGILYVKIHQKTPEVRVFSPNGDSYYLDGQGVKLTPKPNLVLKVPVFTGVVLKFPLEQTQDSLLVSRMIEMGELLKNDAFWNAQIEQIDVTADGSFELIPKVGNTLILLGKEREMKQKLDKLLTFYKEGLNNIGWGMYDTLDLRFKGQVVAKRNTSEVNPIIMGLKRNQSAKDKMDSLKASHPKKEVIAQSDI